MERTILEPRRKVGGAVMEREYKCRVVAWWTSGQTGLAKSDSAPNAIHFTAPPEFGGLEGRWTPEELLLAALASCFTTTFKVVAAAARFDYTDLEVSTEGAVSRTESGYRFTDVVLRPILTISGEERRGQALELLEKTRNLCLVSRALSASPLFEPQVEMSKIPLTGNSAASLSHRL